MMVVASETGVLTFDAAEIKEKGRLRPGKIIMVDMEKGEVYYDAEVKEGLAKAYPYSEWLRKNRVRLEDISSGRSVKNTIDNYPVLLKAFGYHKEDIEKLIVPMASAGAEPTASMGNDTPLAIMSDQPQRLFNYFRQQFAQVTNPPIDPIREQLVMSLTGYIGAIDKNLLNPSPELCKMVKLSEPIITNQQLDLLCNLRYKGFRTLTLPMLFSVKEGAKGMEKALEELCHQAEKAIDEDYNYIVLTDRGVSSEMAAIPSLLAVSAVHNYLIASHKRTKIALIVESSTG